MLKSIYNCQIGELLIEINNEKVSGIEFVDKSYTHNETEIDNNNDKKLLDKVKEELNEYFRGERFTFDLPLQLKGTDYQKKVWEELKNIPYGTTCSYKEISVNIGNPKGSRSVGMACGKNNIIILIPCHRVIGSNGKLTGFSGGIDKKTELLNLENNKKQINIIL